MQRVSKEMHFAAPGKKLCEGKKNDYGKPRECNYIINVMYSEQKLCIMDCIQHVI
jgi:hypothetical protein